MELGPGTLEETCAFLQEDDVPEPAQASGQLLPS